MRRRRLGGGPHRRGATGQGFVPLASVLGAVVIWSTSFVATKVALAEVPPLTLGATRSALAAVLLGIVAVVFGAVRVASARDLGLFALGGFLGITLYLSVENVGVDLATASDAALVVASYPAITMLLEAGIYRRRLSMLRLSGALLAVLGVNAVLGNALTASASQEWDSSRLLGCAVLLVSGLVWALYNFTTRDVVGRYPMLTVIFWQTLFGALLFLPAALVEQRTVGDGRWVPADGAALLSTVHLGVMCSVVAFLLYGVGLRGLDASSTVSVMNLVPVLGVAFAVVLLDEPLGVLQILGGIVVITGVTLGVWGGTGEVRGPSQDKAASGISGGAPFEKALGREG